MLSQALYHVRTTTMPLQDLFEKLTEWQLQVIKEIIEILANYFESNKYFRKSDEHSTAKQLF